METRYIVESRDKSYPDWKIMIEVSSFEEATKYLDDLKEVDKNDPREYAYQIVELKIERTVILSA